MRTDFTALLRARKGGHTLFNVICLMLLHVAMFLSILDVDALKQRLTQLEGFPARMRAAQCPNVNSFLRRASVSK